MTRKNAKLNDAKLKTLPLGKTVCDGNNLYFMRTGDAKGKFTFRHQRLYCLWLALKREQSKL